MPWHYQFPRRPGEMAEWILVSLCLANVDPDAMLNPVPYLILKK